MALRDTASSFDLNGLDLGDITVTAMRDTAGTGESTYSLSSSSSTSCMGCSGCGGCSVQNPMTAETY
ncbi:thiazolylpeptide-type bacteriocin [Streptomyces inusitatus]|uniref:thiazolylpeptide-type bacteriocin n=1 Tax=Streptomyces inusitatus TaxID=68221 RepID=UPI00167CC574|nr:thiazolylpeptide-type bacteriocin [Streptomyces inusitatus]